MHFADFVQIRLSPATLLLLTIFGQTLIMGFAWGFTGAILYTEVLALPDHVVRLIVKYPTELTLIVTVIATALAITTSMYVFLYTSSPKYYPSAIAQVLHICRQRSASAPPLRAVDHTVQASHCNCAEQADLGIATEISQAVAPHVGGLCDGHISEHEVCAIPNELDGDMFDARLYSWSTLLLPTPVQWPVRTFGTEIDLGSAAFVSQLSADLTTLNPNAVQAPGFQTINVLTLLSGFSAVDTQGGVETSSIFSFNGVSYNQSTGGVLPAIEEYSGSSAPPGSNVGLAFTGGQVPVNTSFDWGHLGRDAGTQGISKNYTVTQQGLTANVTCQPIDRSHNEFTALNSTVSGSNITFLTWEIVANCSGNLNSITYFTVGPPSGQPDNVTEGFLPTLVCPDPGSTSFNPYKFDIFMAGLYKYDFLPTVVCEVVPYLTTVNVTYNGGIISVDRVGESSGSTSSSNIPVSQYIATVMNYQAGSNQGLVKNTIGDFLTAYGTNNVSVMYSELEDYWRGIAEFSSSQLRAGYSASGAPSNMTRSTSGTMYITTYGWRSRAHTYIFLLVVISMIWLATVSAAGYSLVQEKITATDASFDFSDPVDLIIAASGGRFESQLRDDDEEKGQDEHNEDIAIRFEDVRDKMGRRISKRLVTVPPDSPQPTSA
ncbi:uncharacterized protein EDB93DRAFT_1250391 [Suillus bovinus]|uniref:uncharacterized protein n=1 Tax=Suillus bovinus TaxID=48563 RepID=UPI001B88029D|nr:uncharacterized protein EDB93DRAFT_1250391 [Suillus bovinus]KAG2147886.1 hypothetical protein EDB93DRAFT_1250391 [Suillus bovinus]